MQECFVDLQLTLISYSQPTKVVQPGKRALNYPAVPSQLLTTLNAASCYPRSYPSFAQRFPALSVVVPFVSMQLHRSLASASPASSKTSLFLGWLDSIHYFHKHVAVVNISTGADYRKRDT